MKTYTVSINLSIESENNIFVDDITNFLEELSEVVENQSNSDITITDFKVDDIEDLSSDIEMFNDEDEDNW